VALRQQSASNSVLRSLRWVTQKAVFERKTRNIPEWGRLDFWGRGRMQARSGFVSAQVRVTLRFRSLSLRPDSAWQPHWFPVPPNTARSQPPQSVHTGAGSVRQTQSGSSTGSRTPSVYSHPAGPVPLGGGYAPSVDASHHSHQSSLV